MTTTQLVLLFIMLGAILVLLVLLLFRQQSSDRFNDAVLIHEDIRTLKAEMQGSARATSEFNKRLRSELNDSLRNGMKTQSDQLLNASKLQTDALAGMQDRMVTTMERSIDRLQKSNEQKLDQIRGVVDEKLDQTLNDRLDSNFRQVGDQLAKLYQSLGELQHLSEGVTDLNRTLSNVKTRGTWGEVQLGRILEQTMTASQYETNVAIKRNSDDRVEFAVKFPAQDGSGDSVYLPIDSKFPADLYNRIIDASEAGDTDGVENAVGALKGRILEEARTIRDKYLAPPRTTNYAIMFLPTEGLYAEVLRIDGLAERCQNMGVLVAGPTTITAILNSLQAGFRNIMLSKKSVEVMKMLEAVKAQFERMDDEVVKTRKKLSEAVSSTDKLYHRTEIIRRKMRNIGEMEVREADEILRLETDLDDEI